MRNKKIKIGILVIIAFLGIGFALLTTTLSIDGTTRIKKASWNVHLENIQVSEGSMDVYEPTMDEDGTTVNYSVHLDLPGDFYEFTVDAVNAGNIDAMIDSVSNSSINSDDLPYVKYSVTYLDGTPVATNDVLRKKTTTTYKVRVEYDNDITVDDLSSADISLNFSFQVSYGKYTRQ